MLYFTYGGFMEYVYLENVVKQIEVNRLFYEYEKNKMELTKRWEIGHIIASYEQKEGKAVGKIAPRLKHIDYSYGYSYLFYYRKYYQLYPKPLKLFSSFTWHHLRRLLPLLKEERDYFLFKAIKENLSVRDLAYQIKNTKEVSVIKRVEVKNPDAIMKLMGTSEEKYEVLILAHLKSFLESLRPSFFIAKEMFYVNSFYIDFLLYSIKYNCYIVILLRFKNDKRDEAYLRNCMQLIDLYQKEVFQQKTLGVIACQKGDEIILCYYGSQNFTLKPYDIYYVNI